MAWPVLSRSAACAQVMQQQMMGMMGGDGKDMDMGAQMARSVGMLAAYVGLSVKDECPHMPGVQFHSTPPLTHALRIE